MNTFYIGLNINPEDWSTLPDYQPPVNDLIKEITGKEIRGITSELWKDLNIRPEVIERLDFKAQHSL